MDRVLVTGASGQVGARVTAALRAAGRDAYAVDLRADPDTGVEAYDVREADALDRVFERGATRTVIHLAAILPTAARADPLGGASVNLEGTLALLRRCVRAGVRRFVFGSSMSAYGTVPVDRPTDESVPASPDDPYGASKRAIETIGEALVAATRLEFVALRMARVVGPGARSTASRWRSDIFDRACASHVRIPFAPTARLSLVHVDEVARMLTCLADAPRPAHAVYNTPVELWETARLAALVERFRGAPVTLGDATYGGPICDGSRLTRDLGFALRGLEEMLAS